MNAVERVRGVCARFELEYAGGPEPTWAGSADGVPIRIIAAPGRGPTRLRFELALPDHRRSLLVVAAGHVLTFGNALRTGDVPFDEHTFLQTADASTLGCFDAPTRALAAELTALGAFVSGGALRLDSEVLSEQQLTDIDEHLQGLVGFAKRLHIDEAHANHEMVRIARSDPNPNVRIAFAGHLGDSAQLRDADRLERVRAESDGEDTTLARLTAQLHAPASGRAVRLEAALRLLALFPLARVERALSLVASDLAAPLIERIAQIMHRHEADEASSQEVLPVAARVLIELAARTPDLDDETFEQLLGALALAPLPESFELVLHLCGRKSVAVVTRALVVLHKLGKPPFDIMRSLSPSATGQLQHLLPTFARNHPELGASLLIEFFDRIEPRNVNPRITYLRAMAATRDVSVGPRLVRELDSPYEEMQLAVVEALLHLGDLSAVPALKPLTEGLFRSSQLKSAARAAIEAIRAREGARALPGALSLAEGGGPGGLAIPPDPEDPGRSDPSN